MAKKPNAPAARRRVFAEAIAKGMSGVDAARAAGFTGKASALKVSASRTLRHPEVQKHLAEIQQAATSEAVADAMELKEFWTSVMRGTVTRRELAEKGLVIEVGPTIADRIKAAELIGKTLALFIDRKQHDGELKVTVRRGNDAAAALPPKEKE